MKFIIDFKNDATEEQISTYLQSLNCTSVQEFNLTDKTYLVECQTPIVFDANIHEHVINDDDHRIQLLSTTVIFDQTWGTNTLAGPTVTISTTDNKDWWKNYVIKQPKFDEPSYSIDRKGDGYVVYMMDSGCELSHPEFTGRPVSNLFTFNGDWTDKAGHGTGLTSVITGNTCGISDATVKVVRIFDKDQPTKQSDMIYALDAIYQDFVSNQYRNAVINCSWTIDKNTFIESKFQILIEMGLIVIAAAGNNGTPIQDVTPASMDTVITIGSFNSDLAPCDFSNYSDSMISVTNAPTNHGELDGWAPGENIYAAGLNGSYGFVAGTSISCAIQSAVTAYNLTTYELSSGKNVTHTEFVAQSSLSRKGILDLSDPKYSTSKNQISTLHDEVATGVATYTPFAKARSGTYYPTRICDPRLYKRIEIYGELPSNTSITTTALFTGLAHDVSEPEIKDIPVKLVNNDDQEFEFMFKVVTLPSTWNDAVDTLDDPELNLMLQFSCFERACADPNCFNNCGGAQCDGYQDKFCISDIRCECNF